MSGLGAVERLDQYRGEVMFPRFRGHPIAWDYGSRQGGIRDGTPIPVPEEFKQRAVHLITDMGMSPGEVAQDLGCSAESVRNWVKPAQIDAGEREGVTSEERQRLRQLERENRLLREEREILKVFMTPLAGRHLSG